MKFKKLIEPRSQKLKKMKDFYDFFLRLIRQFKFIFENFPPDIRYLYTHSW